ncbi:MAG: hypothetical protein P8M80_06400 [Pirellulaceae bacterium]|nr:hypothetical protein [Pirellulaceae bacterium]
MFVGPVFTREAVITPRRPRLYVFRTLYALLLFILMCTAWFVVNGTQLINNVGDLARFGTILFQILCPLQLALIVFLSAVQSASAVSQEKDKNTLILLLLTQITNSELVLGKLFSSLLSIGVMLATAVPIFMLIVLFGGTSFQQVLWVMIVTSLSAVASGSLGAMLGFWREKTFQTLSITALVIVFWVGVFEAVASMEFTLLGMSSAQIAQTFSPIRAIFAAADPAINLTWFSSVLPFCFSTAAIAVLLNFIAIMRVRIWNPSRDVRPGQQEDQEKDSIWGVNPDLGNAGSSKENIAETARSGHVDARVKRASQKSRVVWDNPVLWREICTWAYGRKVLVVQGSYWIIFIAVAAAIYGIFNSGVSQVSALGELIPVFAQPLAPFFLVSLVIINALAVSSVTNERDGRSLDLLLVTDLSPREFLFGKIGGVFYVAKEMVILPLVLCGALWIFGAISLENLIFLSTGLLVLDVFVTMLGIHCGMLYYNSRQAIAVSLGTVFFLFLGIMTCMLIMISFSTTSFESMLAPFLAFIVFGGIGLFIGLGSRNPSSAIALASGALPISMFYAITSFLIGQVTPVYIILVMVYGFTTSAMMIPAISEFNISMGRQKSFDDE